ncbi:ionotropic receptor 21a [Pieris rapae]|uniref:ionotropic receptor 21a n=1 Tax=Pieris rapae TaxID=64459 RepID=UPI001E27E989|nr:ionotropic receptor 21a [Pieris rapae]
MGEIKKTQKVQLHTRFNVLQTSKYVKKRGADPVFHGHPKTREELWRERFLPEDKHFDQGPSLLRLIHNITLKYLTDCTPVLLYDNQIFSETKLFQDLLRSFPVTFIHGYIDDNNRLEAPNLIQAKEDCLHFILFLTDVQKCHKVLTTQSNSKVVVVARSSQWAVQEYLANPSSRLFINLLIVSPSFKDDDMTLEASYILYTHVLYTDGLGSSKPHILTSWTHGKFTRNINLFPLKMMEGYAGHRFLIAVANQPPYTIKRSLIDKTSGAIKTVWDGVEIRIIKLLAARNNFSIEFIEPRELNLGSGDSVANEVALGRADIGIAGLYITAERVRELDLSIGHSQDCAAFITLASTALPRYRAILGPFHWHVWVALTFTYLIAIFPLAFSDKHTLSHLINNSGEVENMFWYVFGTFTNCFTFVGKYSWSKTDKVTTRLLIGWYWLFTIIITSCYTGSIIAFVTLPIYPETIDTVSQLLSGFFRVGTLERGGWERWFLNSSDQATRKLLKNLEFVPDIETGIRNVTKAFFWPYAFLGSRAELEYLIQSNYSISESKRAVLHISNECFVPFTVAYSFPNNSAQTAKLSKDLSTLFQSGIVDKITQDIMWEIHKKGGGKLLMTRSSTLSSNSVEEKGLTLEDTQGMFLLLGAGFLLATIALLSEWMGGFSRGCRQLKRRLSNTDVTSETSRNDSRLYFNPRSNSVESKETLDGQIIHVSQEAITIHNNYDGYDSRRSSSLDLDKEVERIFRRDEMRKLLSKSIEERVNKGSMVFGDQVHE